MFFCVQKVIKKYPLFTPPFGGVGGVVLETFLGSSKPALFSGSVFDHNFGLVFLSKKCQKSWSKIGQNLVKSWSKSGQNLVKNLQKKWQIFDQFFCEKNDKKLTRFTPPFLGGGGVSFEDF